MLWAPSIKPLMCSCSPKKKYLDPNDYFYTSPTSAINASENNLGITCVFN